MQCSQDSKLWAKNAPYAHKDILRTRKYRWDTHPEHGFKAWSIEMAENMVENEISFLKIRNIQFQNEYSC